MGRGRPDRRGRAGETELRALVGRYTSELKAAGAIESAAVERAFRTVERHRAIRRREDGGSNGVLPRAADPGLSARTTIRSVERKGADLLWAL